MLGKPRSQRALAVGVVTVWQQLESGHEFSFESALLAVIKQCEYELVQAAESGCSASGISSYLDALKEARLKYQTEKSRFENALIDEWDSDGGDFSIIAEALRTGYYETLVF